MSDKGKTTAATPSSAKGPKQQSKILAKLRTITSLCGEIEKDEGGLKSYEELLEERRRLDGQLKAKSDELNATTDVIAVREATITALRAEIDEIRTRHQAEKEILMESFAEQASKWKEDSRQNDEYRESIKGLSGRADKAEAEVQRLNKGISEIQSEFQRSSEDLKGARANIAVLVKDRDTKTLSLEVARRNLDESHAELNNLKNEIGIVELDHEETRSHLVAFAADCHKLVRKYFCSNDSDSLAFAFKQFQDQDLKDIISVGFVSLFCGDQSKYMRMVMAEAAISSTLCSNVFRPYYVLDLPETDELLQFNAQKSTRHEALLRCQLVSAFSEKDAHDLAEGAADEVAKFLFAGEADCTKGFYRELVELFRKGFLLWRRVQSSHIRATVRVAGEDWDDATNKESDYDELVALTQGQEFYRPEVVDPVVTLFPRISLGEDVIYRGTALWSAQNVVVAASVAHYGFDKRRSGPTGPLRMANSRRRRSSVTGDSLRSPVDKDGPASLVSANFPSRTQSFSEHAQLRNPSILRSSRVAVTPKG